MDLYKDSVEYIDVVDCCRDHLCHSIALEEAKELQKLRKRPYGVNVEDLATMKTKQKEQSVEVVHFINHWLNFKILSGFKDTLIYVMFDKVR